MQQIYWKVLFGFCIHKLYYVRNIIACVSDVSSKVTKHFVADNRWHYNSLTIVSQSGSKKLTPSHQARRLINRINDQRTSYDAKEKGQSQQLIHA